MKRQWLYFLALTAILATAPADLLARGGGGGGGRGGGGGFSGGGGGFSGGGFSGGGARPTPSASINRSPSMSRPATPSPRPSNFGQQSFGQQSLGTSGGVRTNVGSATPRPAATTRPAPSVQNFQRPTQNQVGDFLGLPASGASSFGTRSAPPTAGTLPSGGGSRSYTTPGGSTITVGGKSGSGTTSGGTQVGGAVGGVKIEGAGGNTYVKGVGGVGATDGTNSAVRGGSVTGVQGAAGNKAVNVRGGYADSAGNRAIGGATAVQGKGGYTAVNVRGASSVGGVGRVGSATAVRGPGGNVVTAGRGAAFVNGQFVGGQTWRTVNGNFTHWNSFYPGWYGRYPGAWWPGKWAVVGTAWSAIAWSTAGSYCGCEGDGAYYDYGENVTYDDGVVYNGEEPVATAEQYYEQATQIAAAGDSATNEEWLPLGVFAIVLEGQTNADKVVQLALNKEGVVKGNLHDTLADSVVLVSGAVDKKTQRVAMRIQGNDVVVVETGLYNLTNDEVPAMVHLGAGRQEMRTLIRLQKPEEPASSTEGR